MKQNDQVFLAHILDAITQIKIYKEDADIIALQEVSPALGQFLHQNLNRFYPYTVIKIPTETTVLLSRYPILESHWFKLEDQDRATLYCKIGWNGKSLRLEHGRAH